MPRFRLRFIAVCSAALLQACSDGSDGPGAVAASQCAAEAAEAVRVCVAAVSEVSRDCYLNAGSACEDNDPAQRNALTALTDSLGSSCADGELLGLDSEALAGRMTNACVSQADSIAWRSYGGPQGAVISEADEAARSCLETAHSEAAAFFDSALAAANACLAADECDATATAAEQATAMSSAMASIGDACPALEELVALTPEQFISNTADQVDCIVATSHEDTDPLELGCGPSNVDQMPARGEWTQLVLDGDKWGSLCGDGTDYAIQVRLAPEGEPIDRVIVALEGGGVCLFEDDCRARLESSPQLFNAQDEPPGRSGLVGDDPDNPFRDWTLVYLPYCNQDVFIGGGIVEEFSDFSVPRYGTINLRAGMRVARDIIWSVMDESVPGGFRPDELVALFGGFSAGGYGALYNYHWVLDDLQWPRTAAFPDAGGALDNGEIAGVRGLGFVKIPVWGAQAYLPPYCFGGDCAVGPDNYRAISPRLKQVPEQQYLILSNQKDNTQQRDAFFSDEAQWIDAMREAYCETKDLPGIQWYLTSDSVNSVHVVSVRDEFYYGSVAGERMVDWFWRAVTDPDSIEDRAEEGNFTTDIPGSNPFPCELP